MATMRTPKERAAIAARCVELEKEGGDILGYLWSENYLTPRATWCNIQREWLGRKPYEFTDGKPKEKKRKEKENMAKRRSLTSAERTEALRIALDGGDPRKYLEEIGISEPSNTWAYIKMTEKQRNPDVYAKIPKRLPVNGLKNKAAKKAEPETVLDRPKEDFEKAPTLADAMAGMKDAAETFFGQVPALKVDGPIRIETPEANQVQVAEVPEKCTIKGPVEKALPKIQIQTPPITKPVVYDGMIIREVEGAFGRYRYTDIGTVEYIDFESTDQMDVLSLSIGQWRNFREEQKKAAQILGVEL
jgi:hypothetical protein